MFRERVFRIDLLEFAPDATGLIDLAEMTESRSKYGAAKIRFWSEDLNTAAAVSYLRASKYAMPRKWKYCAPRAGSRRIARSISGIASNGRPDRL